MARIKHPRPQLGRIRDAIGGVEFIDGYADIDLSDKPNLRDAYALHGYEVEPEVAEVSLISGTAAAGHDGGDSLDSLSVPELKALADEAGIVSKSSWRKPDYVEALANHLETVIGTSASDSQTELRKSGVEESELPAAAAGAEALAAAGTVED